MKHTSIFQILKVVVLTAFLSGAQSCSKDAENDLMAANSQLSQTELTTILEADQWTGALDEILLDLIEKNEGISAKFTDENCYEISYTDTGFRAVFGNCFLNATDKVSGVLEVTYSTNQEVTSFAANYSDFYVGSVQVNGNRNFTISQSQGINLILTVESEMTVVLEDGTTLMEKGIKNIEFLFGESLIETSYQLTGEWTVTKGDMRYSVSTTQPLLGNLQCQFLVSGLMDINKNGLEIGVDFGDGSCDSQVTLIYPNGSTEELEL